ncbi:MAG: DUF2141 domain-containing protein [Polyangiaceae bacterium]|nr:DUF2141 domain-containing protein [Polyangiaceae bacterium]MCE7892554.1 DUF2141 domain-containing protein [Sorangiineae bacterium PRO1]MCL4752443.1 DUF2141 domain-containing protein [Myxococcales bacterium]
MRERVLLFALAITLLADAGIAAPPPAPSVVTVVATGLRNDKGQVVCALFASDKHFPDGEHALRGDIVKVASRRGTCRFAGVAPGTYAVALFHDENSDKVLNTFLGIPREGFAFSRNAPPSTFGPPKFAAAAFRVVKGDYTLTVSMRYM